MNKEVKKTIYSYFIDDGQYSETKLDLYSVLVDMILSRKVFKSSKELKKFTSGILNMEFRNYVFNSRAVLLGRIMKEIRLMEVSDVINIEKNLIDFIKTIIKGDGKNKSKEKKEGGFIAEWHDVIGGMNEDDR